MVERLMCTQFLAGLVLPVPYDSALPQHGHWVARWVPGKRPNTTRNNVRFPFFRGFGILPELPYSYAYDVDPDSQVFMNRRVFAYADTGIPDGVQVDTNGNVYSGCGDGVQVRSLPFFSFLQILKLIFCS